jgi:hypothetical protein
VRAFSSHGLIFQRSIFQHQRYGDCFSGADVFFFSDFSFEGQKIRTGFGVWKDRRFPLGFANFCADADGTECA